MTTENTFADGVRYALDYLKELFDVESTDLWAEFNREEEN